MDVVTEIARVTEATPDVVEAIARLLPQLTPNAEPPDLAHLRLIVASDATRLLVARTEGQIVGMATLILAPISTGFHAYVEDVVVDESHRGSGIAGRLVDAAIDAAARAGADHVELTSHASREEANRLYQRLGFIIRETNVYRYSVD
jgi:ribosomal protein S18 acetylase RimI-like enzyme